MMWLGGRHAWRHRRSHGWRGLGRWRAPTQDGHSIPRLTAGGWGVSVSVRAFRSIQCSSQVLEGGGQKGSLRVGTRAKRLNRPGARDAHALYQASSDLNRSRV